MRHVILAAVVFCMTCGGVANGSTLEPLVTSLPLINLSKTTRTLIGAAAGPSGFASLGQRSEKINRIFGTAPLPLGYTIYGILGTPASVRFQLVVAPQDKDDFAVVWSAASTVAHSGGYKLPTVWLAEVERIVAPYLGKEYRRYPLRNGALFYAKNKPAVEFFFVNTMPSGSATERGYNMGILIFRARGKILQFIDSCNWWMSTPPPGWSASTQPGGCTWKWAKIEPHS
jgi:hypothetical protein